MWKGTKHHPKSPWVTELIEAFCVHVRACVYPCVGEPLHVCAVLSKCLTHQGLDRTISILFPFVPSHTHTCTHSFAPALSLFISEAICYKVLAEHQRRLAPNAHTLHSPRLHPNDLLRGKCRINNVSEVAVALVRGKQMPEHNTRGRRWGGRENYYGKKWRQRWSWTKRKWGKQECKNMMRNEEGMKNCLDNRNMRNRREKNRATGWKNNSKIGSKAQWTMNIFTRAAARTNTHGWPNTHRYMPVCSM